MLNSYPSVKFQAGAAEKVNHGDAATIDSFSENEIVRAEVHIPRMQQDAELDDNDPVGGDVDERSTTVTSRKSSGYHSDSRARRSVDLSQDELYIFIMHKTANRFLESQLTFAL